MGFLKARQVLLEIMTESIQPFNRNSIFSFVLALIALLALCAGILPVPFTVLLCYPPGVILAVVSFALGIKSQRQLRTSGGRGESLAKFGVWISGLCLFVFAFMIMAGVIFVPRIAAYLSQYVR
jgi:hypothetical protein